MNPDRTTGDDRALSVVIPSYNSSPWLPSTFAALEKALLVSRWKAEIVVVDDGSTDDTAATLRSLSASFAYPVRVVTQENKGRFLARWEGIQAARNELVLILDSRLLVNERSLAYLESAIRANPDAQAWNGHVDTDPAAPLVGRFWEVPTYTFWGAYLKKPRVTLITLENFDRVPKGTGFLIIQKDVFARACTASWPSENAHLTSDDTKLLRFIAAESPIRLDPDFSALYRPRTTIRQFLAHGWARGTLFVDSYAGTSLIRNVILLALAVAPPVLLVLLGVLLAQGAWPAIVTVVGLTAAGIALPLLIASARGCPTRARLSYITYVLPFGVIFWAGLSRGILVHRKSFLHRTQLTKEALS